MSQDFTAEVLNRPFGAANRRRMLEKYFGSAGAITPANAWTHVYRLLLWADRTTGVAHCYESDKAQPGRPWYARSLAFHGWLADELQTNPAELGQQLDWLFKEGTTQLALASASQRERRATLANEQREKYQGQGFPLPGEDPELEGILREHLSEWLEQPPPREVWRALVGRIRSYLTQENKRKNLLGEGFEDVLAFILERLPNGPELDVRTRAALSDLPGFHRPRPGEKIRRVDLAVLTRTERRILITVKWSVRADREEQFGVDFETYARLEAAGKDFDFVLITNEFDAARLAAACRRRRENAFLFTSVVHVNPLGPLVAYGGEARRSATALPEQIDSHRLVSLEQWLNSLTR